MVVGGNIPILQLVLRTKRLSFERLSFYPPFLLKTLVHFFSQRRLT